MSRALCSFIFLILIFSSIAFVVAEEDFVLDLCRGEIAYYENTVGSEMSDTPFLVAEYVVDDSEKHIYYVEYLNGSVELYVALDRQFPGFMRDSLIVDRDGDGLVDSYDLIVGQGLGGDFVTYHYERSGKGFGVCSSFDAIFARLAIVAIPEKEFRPEV